MKRLLFPSAKPAPCQRPGEFSPILWSSILVVVGTPRSSRLDVWYLAVLVKARCIGRVLVYHHDRQLLIADPNLGRSRKTSTSPSELIPPTAVEPLWELLVWWNVSSYFLA